MTIDDAITKIDAFLANLDEEMVRISEELAVNAKSMIMHRIQTEGLPGRHYSTMPLPPYFFDDRALNAGGRRLLDRHEKKAIRDAQRAEGVRVRKNKALDELDDGISYYEWRLANGLQVGFVDLTFTGRMWQNTGPVVTEKHGDVYVTKVTGFNEETRQKLRWNAERFGDFFAVTQEERQLLDHVLNNRIHSLEKKYLA